MLCCHVALPHMIERDEGIIVNMSGGGAEDPMTGGSGYDGLCLILALIFYSAETGRCKTKNENNHGDAEYKENRKIEKGRGI